MTETDFQGELGRLHSASFGWALWCCDHRREEAEEVLQTAYLKVMEGTARFDGKSSLRTWFFGVIRRRAAEQRRRRWLHHQILGRWITRQPAPVAEPDPEAVASGSESSRALLDALSGLPGRQREVLHLVFYQDLTVEEASRILGVSLGTARTHFARGKARLRQILGEPERQSGNFNFSFGPGTGIGYSVNISSSSGRLGLNSFPNSTMIANGNGPSGTNDVSVVFGYYVENSTGPVSLDGLSGGSDITEQFTDQGRNLQLNHVNLGPFSWQVYVSQSNNFPVSVTNSKINEIGALTNGQVNISNSVLQLAVTGAFGPGSVMNISNTQIWSQTIQAANGGQLTITDSQLHGNFISAAGAGSIINMNHVGEERNGVPPQSCAPVNGAPPNSDGVPLCNPFNPLYQCSQVVPPTGGATITATPSLTCPVQ